MKHEYFKPGTTEKRKTLVETKTSNFAKLELNFLWFKLHMCGHPGLTICYLCMKGILLKGGQVLDALASCHTIAFDKTGTLTTGGLMFKAIEPIYGHLIRNNRTNFTSCCIPSCEKEALAVAAAMEKGTTHPIGR